eukprot:scaffold185625_cov20-Tisochrysis_lutea.AAC.1
MWLVHASQQQIQKLRHEIEKLLIALQEEKSKERKGLHSCVCKGSLAEAKRACNQTSPIQKANCKKLLSCTCSQEYNSKGSTFRAKQSKKEPINSYCGGGDLWLFTAEAPPFP